MGAKCSQLCTASIYIYLLLRWCSSFCGADGLPDARSSKTQQIFLSPCDRKKECGAPTKDTQPVSGSLLLELTNRLQMGSLGIFSPNSLDGDGETALAFPCGRLGGTWLTRKERLLLSHSVTHVYTATPNAQIKKVNNLFALSRDGRGCFAADALCKLTR